MELRASSMQNNQILHLVPLSDILAFTVGGEFRVFSDGAPAITPASVSIKIQGYAGASNAQPVVSANSVLYAQAQGARIREIAYSWESNAYKSVDISVIAPHLTDGYTLTQLAYAKAPFPMLWAVRSDGDLLGLTHLPEQQVYGWHKHDRDGWFKSVCVVNESGEDRVYAVVYNAINGRVVRYIERMATQQPITLEQSFFLDSAVRYVGGATTTFSGVAHLQGKTVDILADGAVLPQQVVSGNTISLAEAAASVVIGLPMTSDIQTLPLAFEGAQASGQGTLKNVGKVHLRVVNSSAAKVGPSFTQMRYTPARAVADPYGSAPARVTGEVSVTIDPTWGTDATVCVRQDKPVPLTLASMTLEIQPGG